MGEMGAGAATPVVGPSPLTPMGGGCTDTRVCLGSLYQICVDLPLSPALSPGRGEGTNRKRIFSRFPDSGQWAMGNGQ